MRLNLFMGRNEYTQGFNYMDKRGRRGMLSQRCVSGCHDKNLVSTDCCRKERNFWMFYSRFSGRKLSDRNTRRTVLGVRCRGYVSVSRPETSMGGDEVSTFWTESVKKDCEMNRH